MIEKKNKRTPSGRTSAEHDAWLKETGQYDQMIANQQRRAEEIKKHAVYLSHAQAPLVAKMRALGYDIRGVGQLGSTITSYASLIPLLLAEARDASYPPQIRDGIIRALGTTQALPYWKELVELLYDPTLDLPPTEEYQFLPGLAVAEASDDSVIDDIIRFAKDVTLGEPRRSAMVVALSRSKSPKAKMALMELKDDPELKRHITWFRRIARLENRKRQD